MQCLNGQTKNIATINDQQNTTQKIKDRASEVVHRNQIIDECHIKPPPSPIPTPISLL